MTLDKKQKKEIKKIVKLWQKGELLPQEFYERLKQVEGINWATQKEIIEKEVDQIVSLSGEGRTPLARIMIILFLAVAGVIVLGIGALSIWEIYTQGEQLIAESDQLADSVATISTQIDRINEEISRQTTTIIELDSAIATIQGLILELQRPLVTPEQEGETDAPLHIPVPVIIISGSVITTNLEQIHHNNTEFILYSGDEERGWLKAIRFSPAETGEFALIVPVAKGQQFYRLDINPPQGTYIENIDGVGEWQIVTDPISGLIAGLEYSQVFTTTAVLSDIQVSLAKTPIASSEPITGTYNQGNLRTAPFETADTLFDITGTVSPTVTVLGQWVNWQWQLVCCQETNSDQVGVPAQPDKQYFWSGMTQEGDWLVTVSADQASQVPEIYLPVGFNNTQDPPPGWIVETVDGVAILSSEFVTDTQSLTLEWRIDNVDGWFQLEAWMPKGSEATTYQVVLAESEHFLVPFTGSTTVTTFPVSILSDFHSIGTYRLNEQSTIIVRLSTTYEGVKAGLIRLTRLNE